MMKVEIIEVPYLSRYSIIINNFVPPITGILIIGFLLYSRKLLPGLIARRK